MGLLVTGEEPMTAARLHPARSSGPLLKRGSRGAFRAQGEAQLQLIRHGTANQAGVDNSGDTG